MGFPFCRNNDWQSVLKLITMNPSIYAEAIGEALSNVFIMVIRIIAYDCRHLCHYCIFHFELSESDEVLTE